MNVWIWIVDSQPATHALAVDCGKKGKIAGWQSPLSTTIGRVSLYSEAVKGKRKIPMTIRGEGRTLCNTFVSETKTA